MHLGEALVAAAAPQGARPRRRHASSRSRSRSAEAVNDETIAALGDRHEDPTPRRHGRACCPPLIESQGLPIVRADARRATRASDAQCQAVMRELLDDDERFALPDPPTTRRRCADGEDRRSSRPSRATPTIPAQAAKRAAAQGGEGGQARGRGRRRRRPQAAAQAARREAQHRAKQTARRQALSRDSACRTPVRGRIERVLFRSTQRREPTVLDTLIRAAPSSTAPGAPARRADVGIRDGRIVAVGDDRRGRGGDDRRRRPRRRARLRRPAHALRRAAVLGPGRDAVEPARRHEHDRRQLRLHARAARRPTTPTTCAA